MLADFNRLSKATASFAVLSIGILAGIPAHAQFDPNPRSIAEIGLGSTFTYASEGGTTLCSPVAGQWYFLGNPGPFITQYGNQLKVDMSIYGRPTATGRILSPS